MDQREPERVIVGSNGEIRDEITLKAAIKVVWRARMMIVLVTALFTGAAALATFLVTPKYQVTLVALPASEQAGSSRASSASSLLSQVGLGSIAGLASSGGSRKVEAIALLESESLTQRFIAQNGLLPVLFESRWDSARGRWKSDDPKKVPTLWAASQRFSRIRVVDENRISGLVTLKVSWKDPAVAAKWANGLIAMTNDYLRNKSIHQSERNVAYLNDQASKTSEVEVRQAIYSLLEDEFKKLMMARGDDEYALRVVDPALPPDKPVFPMPALWVLAGFLAGLFVSTFAAFITAK